MELINLLILNVTLCHSVNAYFMSIVNAHTVGLLCPGLHCYYLWEYRLSNTGVLLVPMGYVLLSLRALTLTIIERV